MPFSIKMVLTCVLLFGGTHFGRKLTHRPLSPDSMLKRLISGDVIFPQQKCQKCSFLQRRGLLIAYGPYNGDN
jgi:hypothetical protein